MLYVTRGMSGSDGEVDLNVLEKVCTKKKLTTFEIGPIMPFQALKITRGKLG